MMLCVIPHLDAAERIIEQQVVIKLGSTGPIVWLHSQPLDLSSQVSSSWRKMLTQFG